MKIAQMMQLIRDWADEQRVPESLLLFEINRVAYRIQTELLLKTSDIVQYDKSDIEETELLLGDSDPEVYLYYVVAILSHRRGEYEEYQNQKTLFDAAWATLERRLALMYRGGTSETNPYEGGG